MQRLTRAAEPGTPGRKPGRFGEGSDQLRVLRALAPYVWPSDRPDLQATVVLSLVLVLVAKLVTVAMPFTFKWATDALVAAAGGTVPPERTLPWLVGAPVLATLLYGLARVAMSLLVQVREGMFARVAMHAVRKLALNTFEHMHRLSLRFHLERKTGGLTRVLERGRLGIENITRMTLMTFVPTIVEFALVLAVLLYQFDWRYAGAVTLMIVLYLWFTVRATDWRIKIRRAMNESDSEANTKAIDSLLNYETVKYFGAEAREARRYDQSVAAYERASVKTYTSLAVLNAGQAVIFTLALTGCMTMVVLDILAGTKTIGDFVMINALLLQLFIPLNFMGMVYREIKQSLTDIERMMDVLEENPEVADRPGAVPLEVAGGTIRFEDVKFCYEPERIILDGLSFEVPAGKMVAIVGPSGAGKSTVSRILLRFYDVAGGRVTIDGQDIRDVTQASLRAALGVVPQDTVLFNDTILYNIRYGRPDGHRRGGAGSRAHGADRRVDRQAARRLRHHGRRARLEALRRREAARRHRPHHPQRSADPAARRGDERARQPHREGDPGRARRGVEEPHHRRHRPPALHHRRRRQYPGARCRPAGGAGHARASCWPRAAFTPACGTASARPRRRARCWPKRSPRKPSASRTAGSAPAAELADPAGEEANGTRLHSAS